MADLVITRPNPHGLEAATLAVEAVAERLQREFGLATRADGEALLVEGHGVRGRLEASAEAIRVEAKLGLRARPFRRLLRREIEAELDRFAATPPTA